MRAVVEKAVRYIDGDPADPLGDDADPDDGDALRKELEEWKRRYFLVADAVAPRSDSAEHLADIARSTRAEADAALRRHGWTEQASLFGSFRSLVAPEAARTAPTNTEGR